MTVPCDYGTPAQASTYVRCGVTKIAFLALLGRLMAGLWLLLVAGTSRYGCGKPRQVSSCMRFGATPMVLTLWPGRLTARPWLLAARTKPCESGTLTGDKFCAL